MSKILALLGATAKLSHPGKSTPCLALLIGGLAPLIGGRIASDQEYRP